MIAVQLHKRTKKLRDGSRVQYWTLRWYGSDGRRYSESIGTVGELTKNAAESRRREKEAQFNAGQVSRDKPKDITLAAFITFDLDATRHDLKRNSLEGIRHAGSHAVGALGGEKKIASITQADIGRIKTHIIDKRGCSPATLAKTLRTLKAMFNRAIDYGFLRDNPFARVRMPKTQSKAKRIFSADEIAAMMEACPTLWWRTFIALAATSGLRKGELANLMWRDVDFESGSVCVSAKRKGVFTVKGRGEFPVLEWSAKSYDERVVPLPARTLSLLASLQAESDGSAYVFLTLERLATIAAEMKAGPLGANYEALNNLAVRFQTIQRRARRVLAKRRGIEVEALAWPTGCLHDLRRTYGTHMSRVVPMHVLKEYMGHSDIKTTQAFYLASEGEDATRARNALDTFLNPDDARRGRTQDAPGDFGPSDASGKNNKPLRKQGLESEADGTRTRNHRIDSPVL